MSLEQENIENQILGTNQKWLRVSATIISYICHPVFMPAVLTYVLYRLTPVSFTGITDHQFGLWMISIVVTTLFFPVFSVALLKPLGFIDSLQMKEAKSRFIPLMISMIFYFWISHVFQNMPNVVVPLILKVLFLGNFWGIVLVFLFNIFTKISMHTSAAGSMVGVIISLMIISPVDMEMPLFVSLIIAGVIGTARMALGAHQKGDIWLGYIVGIIVQIAAYMYLR